MMVLIISSNKKLSFIIVLFCQDNRIMRALHYNIEISFR